MAGRGLCHRGGGDGTREACVARKRGGGMALYVALAVALVLFVPPLRERAADLIAPLLDQLKSLNPLRG
ncbi:putative membrane protein [Saccharothrix espanaensis DSM 44229]|uniref:Putative membrane protein n=1 Tax=Saccharothrix espanaensis (strain ATCC 51144 / DSM 44229 / JCM 9112 / NBRC 15066 / NRRL 15764) TaxID=1179773 RepID=K0K2Y4_SACES|nr:putative membrane protein [Saccharothrix espanaensis DSM 44229]